METKLLIAGLISLASGACVFGLGPGDREGAVIVSSLATIGVVLVALSYVVGYLAAAIRAEGDAIREEIWRPSSRIGEGEEHEEKPPKS